MFAVSDGGCCTVVCDVFCVALAFMSFQKGILRRAPLQCFVAALVGRARVAGRRSPAPRAARALHMWRVWTGGLVHMPNCLVIKYDAVSVQVMKAHRIINYYPKTTIKHPPMCAGVCTLKCCAAEARMPTRTKHPASQHNQGTPKRLPRPIQRRTHA